MRKLRLRYKLLIVLGVSTIMLIGVPLTVGAVTSSDALAGLQQFYGLLVDLAQKALEGYIEYLKALG
jgi:hypothetical protein